MDEYQQLRFLVGAHEMVEKHLESIRSDSNITIPKDKDPQEWVIERKRHFSGLDRKGLNEALSNREPAWQLALMDWLHAEGLITQYQFKVVKDRLTIMIQPLSQFRLVQVALKGETVEPPPPWN